MKFETYRRRQAKVEGAMTSAGARLSLLSPGSDLAYLTGCDLPGDERLLALALAPPGEPFFIANELYREQVKDLPVPAFVFWRDGENPYDILAEEIRRRALPAGRVAVADAMPSVFALNIGAALRADLQPAGFLTRPLRQYKDEEEMAAIAAGSRAADEALRAALGAGREWLGRTESDLAECLAREMRLRGLERADIHAAAGAGAAVPHYKTGGALIADGACLLVDFVGAYEGYYTDMTRTVHFGPPSDEFRAVYAAVLGAHLAAEAAVQAGNKLEDIDIAARNHIENLGYGDAFNHRTGHGIGLDVHEGASVMAGEKTPLAPGLVFSVEPGIYLPGRFGVRIENLVAMTAAGRKVLHAFPRELLVF
ncbi:MAG: Xaa-Pro peptidase family protein [Gracilibacteraceae bacterium]|jgi:Xaa-Pro aminopeptidase|nr:Xaa-Pro peptidase family protein [Gracilibacteraceae bacterium]